MVAEADIKGCVCSQCGHETPNASIPCLHGPLKAKSADAGVTRGRFVGLFNILYFSLTGPKGAYKMLFKKAGAGKGTINYNIKTLLNTLEQSVDII